MSRFDRKSRIAATSRAILAPAILAPVLLASVLLAGCSGFEPGRRDHRGPRAEAGVLDLRSWDFGAEGPASLAGEWLFARGALLSSAEAGSRAVWELRSVPDFWRGDDGGLPRGKGAGTYRLTVILPAVRPPLAIRNYTGMSAFELEVDGRVAAGAGRPALDPELAVSAYRPAATAIPAETDRLELLVRTSNHQYRSGGMWQPLELGPASTLKAAEEWDEHAAIGLSMAIGAISLNAFIAYLFRRKETSFLLFAAFGACIALRQLVIGEYLLPKTFTGIPFGIVVRLEYATAILAVPAAIAFFLSIFPGLLGRRGSLALLLPFAPLAILILLAPLYWLTWSIFFFYALALLSLAAAAVLILARAAKRSLPGARTLLVGVAVLALAGFNDVLYSSHLVQTAGLFPYALALFVVLQSIVLAGRLSAAFGTAERLSAELARANGLLQREIGSSREARARLEISLAEKEILLKEVHHRVKNGLQIVSSIVSLRSHRSNDPAVTEMSRAIRDRIRVISLAHERLYNIDSAERIDLGEYAKDLVLLNVSSIGAEDCPIETEVESPSIRTDADFTIDFGLVLTELLTNSIKHALIPRGGGWLAVEMAEEGKALQFSVTDDGPGFPEGFSPETAPSLGFRVVMALVNKRGGGLSVSAGPGPRVSCSLPLPPFEEPSL